MYNRNAMALEPDPSQIKANLFQKIGFKLDFFRMFFKETSVVKTDIEEWMLNQLNNDTHLKIIAGELGGLGNNDKIIIPLFNAVKRGKKITIVCGPYLLKDKNAGVNKLAAMCLKESKHCKNLQIKIVPKFNYSPKFHFMINGDDVMIEKPHLPSQSLGAKLQVHSIKNSVIWKNRLNVIFSELWNSNRSVSFKSIENIDNKLRSIEEFEEMELSDPYLIGLGQRIASKIVNN